MKTIYILLPWMLFGSVIVAQPANDNCNNATPVIPDGNCYDGTTVNADDSWAGTVGCQSGNNPEVWYSFVATGTTLNINVTAFTLSGNIEFVLVASTGPCSGLTNHGSLCGPSPLTGNISGLQIGTTYYYTISSSTSSEGSFRTCVTNTTPPPLPGQDCGTSARLCNGSSFSQGIFSGVGIPENLVTNSCFEGNERQSKWYKFTIGCNGTLGFVINPNSPTDDYDWAIWNSSVSPCAATMPAPVACNWSGCPGSTGLSANPSAEPNAVNCPGSPTSCSNATPDAYCNEPFGNSNLLNVTAGTTYTILIDNYNANGNGFNFSFNGTAKIGPDATFSVLPGACGTYSFTKTCPTTNSTFLWQFGDGSTATTQNASHPYSTFGNFVITLQVTDALGCVATFSQTINIVATPLPTATSPQTFCSNTNPTIANLTATGTGLQWYNVATGGSALAATTALVSGTYYVSQTVSGCESGRTPVTVTVTATTAPTATSPQTFCTNTNPTVASLTATGTGLQWYNVATGGSALAATTALVSGTYYLSQTVSGCESGRTPVTVTVTATTAPTATSPQTFCSNTNPTVANLTATGTGLQWYNVATGGSALAATTALVSGTYYASQTVSGCESGRTPVTVTVTATTAPTATSPQTFCTNTNPTIANLTATGTGLQWYNVATGGSALAATTALVSGTYYVSQTVSGCESGRTPVTVTVTATTAPTATSPQTFCSNTNPTVANLTATGTGLQWYNAATGGSALAATTALVSGTYYVSQTVSGCESGRTPVTVTVTATTAPTATSPQTFCSNTNPTVANLTATGTGLQWYNAATGGSPLAATTALVSGTYYVSQTVSGCESGRTPVTVTVTATTAPTATSPQTFCSNTNPTVANLTATGTGLQWYNATTGGSVLPATTALVSGTYYVSQTVSGCESGRTPVTVTVTATTAPTATSPQTFCSNTNPTIANLTATGTGLQWYNAATGGSVLPATTALVSGTYYVSQTVSGCESGRTPVTVTVTATTAPTATSPQTFCSNINPTVANLTATGTGLQWYNATTGGSALPATTALVSGTYYVGQTVSGCESGRTPVTVTVTATTAPTATSPQTFCSNTNPTVANLTATGTGLQWYNAATGGSALAATTALVSGTYYVSQTVSGCQSGRTPVTVTVTATTAPTATSPQTFCSNTNPTIANLTATGTGLQWYNVATGGSALAATTALVSGTYYVSQTVSGCESGRTPVTVTVTATTAPTATSPQTFCSNTNPTVTSLTATGTGLQWYNVATGGSALAATTALVSGTYYVSQTVSGCESGRTPVTVTLISLTGSVSIVATSTSICSGGSVTFTATPTNGGSTPTYQWMINGVNVAGQTASTFTTSTLVNADAVSVKMMSNDPCANPTTATSTPVTITTTSVTASVSIIASTTSICSGGSVTFTATPTNGGSTPTYQWMINGVNASGQTASTFTVSTLVNGDAVSVKMTSNDPCANPTTATSTPVTITTTSVTASVSIAASTTSICSGGSVTFTATPTNGGSTPIYQWMINGANVSGQTASTFTVSTLANGDAVSVNMTSNEPCANPIAATSTPITMTTTSVTASVSIAASTTSICNGGSVTFTATATNGGSSPTYQWMINGVNVAGQTASTLTTSTLANGDAVSVKMTSSDPCANPTAAASNQITITTTSVTASVSITASTTSICSGGAVTFTATPTNGGSSPTYQWMINGVNVAGQTASTFTTSTLANGDGVSVKMTSNDPCANPATATSTSIAITSSLVTPSVSITASTTSICSGGPVTFTATATNGGSTPTYQWMINGANVSGQTASTFTTATLANGDAVSVIMTSSDPCATPTTPVQSQAITFASNKPVLLIRNPAPVCEPSTIDLTASSVTAGSDPGLTYTYWLDSNATVPLVNANAVSSTSIGYIKAQSTGGCFTVSPVFVSIEQKINGIRYPTVIATVNSPLQLQARNLGVNYTYTWVPVTGLDLPNVINPVFTHDTQTQYLVNITSPAGCVTVDTQLVRIDGPIITGPAVFVPKAWSPNNDGHNDNLFPFLVNITRIKYFRIYNRWGIKVFETNIVGQGWNGIYNGKPQMIDVYTWTIEAESTAGYIYKSSGTSVLLR